MDAISRRLLLSGGTGAALCGAAIRREKSEDVYRFATAEWDIRVTIEFHDRQSSATFGFMDRMAGRRYCLSGQGEENANCLKNFVGSLAIARYQIRPRGQRSAQLAIQEKVRTIDADSRLPNRPPFERLMEAEQGMVSDIQAFGYEASTSAASNDSTEAAKEPWSLLRQDLFFGGHPEPFLVIHWKHTLSAIRVLDMIPGRETMLMSQRA